MKRRTRLEILAGIALVELKAYRATFGAMRCTNSAIEDLDKELERRLDVRYGKREVQHGR